MEDFNTWFYVKLSNVKKHYKYVISKTYLKNKKTAEGQHAKIIEKKKG